MAQVSSSVDHHTYFGKTLRIGSNHLPFCNSIQLVLSDITSRNRPTIGQTVSNVESIPRKPTFTRILKLTTYASRKSSSCLSQASYISSIHLSSQHDLTNVQGLAHPIQTQPRCFLLVRKGLKAPPSQHRRHTPSNSPSLSRATPSDLCPPCSLW